MNKPIPLEGIWSRTLLFAAEQANNLGVEINYRWRTAMVSTKRLWPVFLWTAGIILAAIGVGLLGLLMFGSVISD